MDLEKQIEEAAKKYADYVVQEHSPTEWSHEEMKSLMRANFEGVIKSEAAKQYWKAFFDSEKSETEKRLEEYIKNNFDGKPSYSEEEIQVPCLKAMRDSLASVGKAMRGTISDLIDQYTWFEQNKKK